MKKLETWAIAAIFIALISIPLIVFAAGARPEPNQNRPPTPLPEVSASGILNRELTPQIDAYLEDALIIAPGAVAAEAWTDVALGDSPSEEVTLGANGWLYYTFSLTRPCLSPDDVTHFVDIVSRSERAVATTGRRLLLGVAPDKATIVPEFLPDTETCVHDVASSLESADTPDSFITVWDDMRKARATDRPIYFRLDTHWTNQGASVMGAAFIEMLESGGWEEDAVVELDTVDHEGDLTVLLGLPATEPAVELETRFPDTALTREIRKLETATGNEYERVVAVDFSIDRDPVVPGQTLVMHDSYGWALTPMIAPYFESAAFIAEVDPGAGHMWVDLNAADTVVFEIVQRSIHEFVLDADLAARFVAGYADSYERLTQPTALSSPVDLTRPEAVDGDVYVIVDLAGSEPAEVSFGDQTAALSLDSPRGAFHVADTGTDLTATGAVDYYLVVVPR